MSKCKIYKNGDKYWFNRRDQLHRINGPAIIYKSGTKCWYKNDRLHRLDGPAIDWYNGTKWWYLNGKQYTKEDYLKELKKYITKEEMFILRLKYE